MRGSNLLPRRLVGLVLAWLLLSGGAAQALEPTDKWEGAIDYAATGASLLEDTCYASVFNCMPGEFDGQGDTVTSLSTAYLDGVPTGEDVSVIKAYLVWMGSVDPDGGEPDANVNLRPPQGEDNPIMGQPEQLYEISYQDTDVNDQPATFRYFTYRVDITEILREHYNSGKPLNGEYTLAGYTGYADEPYKLRQVALAGWSLFLVYSNPEGASKRIYYYTDFRFIRDDEVVLLPSGFEVPQDPEAKLTLFLGEGDQAIAGMGSGMNHNERLLFNGTVLMDPCNDADNAYNSTVNTNIKADEEPCRINQYSIDLDTFFISNLLQYGDTDAEIVMSLGQDQVFTNYIILSIDTKRPDFDIPNLPEKSASVTPGDALIPEEEFTYYIYVQNTGADVATGVKVRDDLPSFVSYRPGTTVVVEPNGERRPVADPSGGECPCLYGIDIADNIPPGELYQRTVEIGVRLNSLNEGVTKESIIENTAEIISGAGDVFFTNNGTPVRHTVRLESYEGTLHIDEGSRHPQTRFVSPGSTNVPAAHINLRALEGTVKLSSFRFTAKEGGNLTLVESAKLFVDANGNGTADAEEESLGGASVVSGGGLLFSDFSKLPQVTINEEVNLLLTVDISEDAAAGNQLQFQLTEDNVSVRGYTEGLPLDCALLAIPAEGVDASIELGFSNPPDGFISQGSADEIVMQLLLRGYSEGVTLEGLGVVASGTVYDTTEITKIALVHDQNGNGVKDGPEAEVAALEGFAADDGSVNFQGLALTVPNGGSLHLLVTASFSGDTRENSDFQLTVPSEALVDAGTAVVAGTPVVGSRFTISSGQVTQCLTDEECVAVMGSNAYCDQIQGICRMSGSTDGDDSGYPDGDDSTVPDGDDEPKDKKGGGCRLPGPIPSGLAFGFLLLGFFILRRARRERDC